MRPPPQALKITLDRSALLADGQTLVGGSPRRLLRLSAAGRRALEELAQGRPESAAARHLGRRLIDAEIAHPHPEPCDPRGIVTVVIPVRDRPRQLARCLAALDPELAVTLVDDGSQDGGTVAAIASLHGARLVRHERASGPAAARNAALGGIATELVAFLDSDCVPSRGWLRALVGHFEDETVAAVAPRVRPLAGGREGAVKRYLQSRSPLDMGPHAAVVRPGGRVSYVPSAALLVRRSALQGGGFDEDLRHGEDVDLVWRLHDAGWRVRYDPSAIVEHDEPNSLRAVLARRFRYGTSAAPLSARHPDRLACATVHCAPAAVAGLLLGGRPKAARRLLLAEGLVSVGRLRRRGVPPAIGARWFAEASIQSLLSLIHAATTVGTPAVLLIACRAPRRLLLGVLALAPLHDWMRTDRRLDAIRWTALALIDDAAYGAGVWWSSIKAADHRPLLPSLARGRVARRRPSQPGSRARA